MLRRIPVTLTKKRNQLAYERDQLKDRILLTFFAVSVLGFSPAYSLMGKRDLPDQIVQTPGGSLTVRHLRYISQGGVYTLTGEVLNETRRDWADLILEVRLTDKGGPVQMKTMWGQPAVLTMDIHIRSLQAGASQDFKFNPFASPDKDSVLPIIAYIDGRFSVNYQIALTKPVTADSPSYETDYFAIRFAWQEKALHFALENKGDNPIRIDWNSVAYVDTAGISQGVIHNGIRLADRSAPKAPTVVPPGSTIQDDIVPVNNIELVNMDWLMKSLLPAGPVALNLVGSKFSVFLPLEIDGKTENHLFQFAVVEVN